MEERSPKQIEEAFELLEQMNKKFKEIEPKGPPCIGVCNSDCGTVEVTNRKVSNFYVDNAL
ncbi:MAG: hypothetical protein WCH05_00795 [Chlorobiaceae bacterium]